MKTVFILFLSVMQLAATLQAQSVTGSVRGILVESISSQPLNGASITVSAARDSNLTYHAISSPSGRFLVNLPDSGNYQLLVTFQGFDTLRQAFSISAVQPIVLLDTIRLHPFARSMQEVVIKDRTPMRIKGDTISYNSDAFTTRPNASAEDLLKKLPGVQVDRDGSVKAQGEAVQKIYVDGKEFFGNDPTQATRNLTADMIDRVEVFDERSDQSKFSGIDDGSRSRTINLKLKKSKKQGLLGRAYAGAGTEGRYETGLSANYFKGAKRVTIIAGSNNTNRLGVGAPASGGSSNNNPSRTGANPGLNRTTVGGIHYNDIWGKKIDMSGSYTFSHLQNTNSSSSRRIFFFPDSTVTRNQLGSSESNSFSHRLQFRINYLLDSQNSILYTPTVSFQDRETMRTDSTESMAARAGADTKVSDSRSLTENSGQGVIFNQNLLYRRRFSKERRTFSANLSSSLTGNNRSDLPFSRIGQYRNGYKFSERIIRQNSSQSNHALNYGIGLFYTEPMGKNMVMDLNYSFQVQDNRSDRKVYEQNGNTGRYDVPSPQQSNLFENRLTFNRAGTNLRWNRNTYNLQLGVTLQQAQVRNNNLSRGKIINQHFTTLIPVAFFNKQLARNKSLRFQYTGNTFQPTPSQLMEIVNKDLPLYWALGNPSLKQEYTNNFSALYNSFDANSFRSFFVSVNVSNTYRKIVNNVLSKPALIREALQTGVADSIPQGVQLLLPVNTGGAYNVTGNMNMNFPVKDMPGTNLNATTTVSFGRNISFADNERNFTYNTIISEDLRLNLNYREKLDMSIGGSINYFSVRNSLQSGADYSSFVYGANADISYTLPASVILSTNAYYNRNMGLTNAFNQDYLLWNASVSRLLFRNKRGELKLSVNDILNKNRSFIRNLADNYIEDLSHTVLKRYALLTFVYHLKGSSSRQSGAAQQ